MQQYFPEIILNKIYFYQWIIKQRELSQEIKRSIIFYDYTSTINVRTKKGSNLFNFRILNDITSKYIYHIYSYKGVVGKLPQNY